MLSTYLLQEVYSFKQSRLIIPMNLEEPSIIERVDSTKVSHSKYMYLSKYLRQNQIKFVYSDKRVRLRKVVIEGMAYQLPS